MTAIRLRALIAAPNPTVLAGCYDGVSARLVQQAGFQAAHMSGFAVAGSLLGKPDVGLLTMTEMADAASRLARVLSIPLLADADTGYGNALNVVRTVEAYIAAGVAGMHLEDQQMPKRCGHLAGKTVVSPDEMASKLRAAIDTRDDAGIDMVVLVVIFPVGIEPALNRLCPVLHPIGRSVGTLPQSRIDGGSIRILQSRIKGGIHRRETHLVNRMGKLVNQDVLGRVRVALHRQQVLLATRN